MKHKNVSHLLLIVLLSAGLGLTRSRSVAVVQNCLEIDGKPVARIGDALSEVLARASNVAHISHSVLGFGNGSGQQRYVLDRQGVRVDLEFDAGQLTSIVEET
jgi:hypothetical protein